MLQWKAGAAMTFLNQYKMAIPGLSGKVICSGPAPYATSLHDGLHHARSSGGPLRNESQASTGISNVKTMTSR
jgi:hypothetical protein